MRPDPRRALAVNRRILEWMLQKARKRGWVREIARLKRLLAGIDRRMHRLSSGSSR